jgi:hypothetical protein
LGYVEKPGTISAPMELPRGSYEHYLPYISFYVVLVWFTEDKIYKACNAAEQSCSFWCQLNSFTGAACAAFEELSFCRWSCVSLMLSCKDGQSALADTFWFLD